MRGPGGEARLSQRLTAAATDCAQVSGKPLARTSCERCHYKYWAPAWPFLRALPEGNTWHCLEHRRRSNLFFFLRFYLFIFRERGREGEREEEKHQCVVASCTPPTGELATTQMCALTGNQTGDPLLRRPTLNPLSWVTDERMREARDIHVSSQVFLVVLCCVCGMGIAPDTHRGADRKRRLVLWSRQLCIAH